nr:hypothetical protein 9 [Gammaproteobacteria bacterium]
MTIHVIDAVMGSGKSSFAINEINSNLNTKYIVVVPTLGEVDRYAEALDREVYVPNNDKNKPETLLAGFNVAAAEGKTIVTTHALLKIWDHESVRFIQEHDYTLILDEVIDVVAPQKITKDDFNGLLETNKVTLEPIHGLDQVKPTGVTYEGKNHQFWNQVKKGNVFRIEDQYCLWLTTPDKLAAFNDVYILTYLFQGQEMSAWLTLFGVPYTLKSIERGTLVNYRVSQGEHFKHLVSITNNRKMNAIGNDKFALSNSWYEKAKKAKKEELKKHCVNFFKYQCKSTHEFNLWSVYKEFKPNLASKPYNLRRGVKVSDVNKMKPEEKATNDCFTAFNLKATNLYKHKDTLAYLVNVFNNPDIGKFFRSRGVIYSDDLHSLSVMVQWIWRSAIREGKPVRIYIPSKRMRTMLEQWLEGTFELPEVTPEEAETMDYVGSQCINWEAA